MKSRVRLFGLIPVPESWRGVPGVVRDLVEADGSLYLRRVYLWPGLYLHHIAQADADRALHNHPWAWAESWILSGGYLEERTHGKFWRSPGDAVALRASTYHRIALVKPGTWTLFRHGPACASWGFHVDGVHVDWKEYR